MSWQLAAFALLGVGLAGGFAWYERSRPDAKTVALVGTLAALACLGRIAFAPIPNVKPTTDIVLISGYALGGAPGYVVGAVAALTSNLFFGQGPWTPWQMAGWGMTGILGAGLARLTLHRLGRSSLTVVCFVVGFAFTALQDAGDWVTYSDHSLAALGAYVGQGLGYDLIHAVGCALFAISFGPAMIRSLQRFRRRLAVDWVPLSGGGAGAGLLVGVVVLLAAITVSPRPARAAPARTPIDYLLAAQNRDGGFGMALGLRSNTMASGWAVLALAATGHRIGDVARGSGAKSAAIYLRQTAGEDFGDPGSIERAVLAAHAAGLDPAALGGRDLTTRLERLFAADGAVADQTNLTAFGILALHAARLPLRTTTVPWLLRQQDADGGFNFATRGTGSDVDDTAAVLEALAAASSSPALPVGRPGGSPILRIAPERSAIARALAFVRAQQNRDGGFPSQPGEPSNAQSTAFAIQGLIAIGLSPGDLHRRGGRSPLQYLHSLTGPSGAISYSKSSEQTPVWVTAEAELALAGAALPVANPTTTAGSERGGRLSAGGASTPRRPPGRASLPIDRHTSSGRGSRSDRGSARNGGAAPRPQTRVDPTAANALAGAFGWIGAVIGLALAAPRA